MSERSVDSDSPTLPLPPPRSQASRLSFEDFVEAATSAAMRASNQLRNEGVQPAAPVARRPIWVGIILDPALNLFNEPQGTVGGPVGGGINEQ